ncbi:MAG: DUF3899 domain-containing protein [Clostridiales bacterium]|nr:DUF3899 domain-containing protein [Clostridiales bacterium]
MTNWKRNLISFGIGCVVIVPVAFWQMSFQEDGVLGRLLSWSNACFLAAVLWGGLGILVWIAAFGGFDAARFLGRTFWRKWSRAAREEKKQSYYDYRVERQKKRKKGVSSFLLLPGAVYLAAAAVLTVLFLVME